ncbi:hypothetical protein E1H12_12680 [Geitlerinema sp. P-1104]|uniref:AAA family ATPase n=1 Tax=Geitlerinema sp. P-1104 TaxID=2546230 RepID=UPI0014775E7D|nr:AAA family ATPase [Geitlerinema sp. P-1104]NMG59347.1 hypothetical protein [Geitlerinema sp. P-1104]
MKSIKIKNLRSLKDTKEVEIKPITVLLGQNSSGKSTFLRTFPLLKQSADSRTIAPILWYGHLVDFGGFPDAVNRELKGNPIGFEFRLEINFRDPSIRFFNRRNKWLKNLDKIDTNVCFEVEQTKKEEVSRLSKIVLLFFGHKVSINLKTNGEIDTLFINQSDHSELGKHIKMEQQFGLLPNLFATTTSGKGVRAFRVSHNYDKDESPLYKKLFHKVQEIAHRNTGKQNIIEIIDEIKFGDDQEILNGIASVPYKGKTWKNKIEKWNLDDADFKDLRDLIVVNVFPIIYESVQDYLVRLARNISYIAPIRASAERYYRLQGLAVDEVDSTGKNLAMFLRNLSTNETKRFRTWMEDNFGYTPEIKSESGHISLKLRDSNLNESFNLADMGFGFSQLLPIVTQLWYRVSSPSPRNRLHPYYRLIPMILAIEQPELHLHPSFQSKIADVLCSVLEIAKISKIDLRLIIETHSEVIINRLGSLIYEKKLKKEDVSIIIFNQNRDELKSELQISNYDEEGFLENWPLGFFNYES